MASSACHAHPLEACDCSFRMESCGMESLDLEKSRVAREKLFWFGTWASHRWRLCAWAALAAALETILITSCVVFSCVDSRGRSLEDLAWRKAGSHARSFLVWDKGIA